MEDARGTPRLTVKCADPWKTTYGEGSVRVHVRHSWTKARGAKQIRYLRSPGRKRCALGVRIPTRSSSAVDNSLNALLGEYARKGEILIELSGTCTKREICGLIG